MRIKLGDKEINLEGAFPITLGDWKRFQKIGIVSEDGNMRIERAENISELILHLCNKVDPDIKEADVDKIPITELPKIAKYLSSRMKTEEEPDRPSSNSWTSSARSTGGASGT